MIANYYTKPLQGSLFRKMRDILMGITPFLDEECVGLNEDVSTEKTRERDIVLKSSKNCSDDVNRKCDDVRSKQISYADKVRTGDDVHGKSSDWAVILGT